MIYGISDSFAAHSVNGVRPPATNTAEPLPVLPETVQERKTDLLRWGFHSHFAEMRDGGLRVIGDALTLEGKYAQPIRI